MIGYFDTISSLTDLENVPLSRLSVQGVTGTHICKSVTVFRNSELSEISLTFHSGPGLRLMPFSLLLDSSIKQLDPEDMDEIEKIEY